MVQPYAWFVGMTLMSNAMHRASLAGVPRRTAEPMFEGAWPLPSESRPETVTVTARVYTGEDVDLTEQEVRLARPSLRG
jgi:hypothetical protein